MTRSVPPKGNSDVSKTFILAAAICVLPLAACSKSPSDKLADRVENAADARADSMENQAAMLNNQADQVRENGKQRSDAIDAADRNVSTMSREHRDAIVAGNAAAVQ